MAPRRATGARLAAWRRRWLVATGGSDWHGGDGLGDFGAGEEVLGDFWRGSGPS
jgi:hypothetical protein